ncbi:hypothetical protein Ancab_008636 [Ancistrocladus abbreviatus]
MVDSLICCLNALVAKPNGLNRVVNFREIFEHELFRLSLKQTLGLDVKSIYVEELGTTLSLENILHILVLNVMEVATEVDWRDFFTYLRFLYISKTEAKGCKDLYKTMAFRGGKRVCTGALQAMLIVCLSIGRLVQDFEWRLEGGEEEDLDTVGFTTHKLHPLHAIIKPRSSTK